MLIFLSFYALFYFLPKSNQDFKSGGKIFYIFFLCPKSAKPGIASYLQRALIPTLNFHWDILYLYLGFIKFAVEVLDSHTSSF